MHAVAANLDAIIVTGSRVGSTPVGCYAPDVVAKPRP
jgi:hypothetical protein